MTTAWERPAPPQHGGAPVGRILMVVFGVLLTLLGLVATIGGGAAVWAHTTQRDDDGFFSTGTERFETTTHAIVSDELDLGTAPGRDRFVGVGDLATVRVRAESATDGSLFVGIGPEDDVADYLRGVAFAEVDDVDFDPFSVEYDYTEGTETPEPPAGQDFWAASAEGSGLQRFDWEIESGRWVIVIMNADGAASVAVDASVGAKIDWLLPVGIGLLAGGLVALIGGVVLLVLGATALARHRPPAEVTPGAAVAAAVGSPVVLEGRLDEPLSRWLWLVKWLLAIPHFLVLALLWVAFGVLTVVAFFVILITGRYPRSAFDFKVGVLRWSWRVTYYALSPLGTDRYPPFTLGPVPDYPATYDVAYPERLSRGLVLVKWWLLAIPHYFVIGILVGSVALGRGGDDGARDLGGPGLIGILVLVAAVVLLFTGRYPRPLFDLVMGLERWIFRVIPYVALMRDEYPPFRLDQGGADPAGAPPSAPAAPQDPAPPPD